MSEKRPSLALSYAPSILLGIGLVALYIGERALGGMARGIVSGLGALVLVAFLVAWLRVRAADGARRQVARRILVLYGVCLAAAAIYFAQSDLLELVGEGKVHTVLQASWPFLLLVGGLPVFFMEMSLASMVRAPAVEPWRVSLAGRGALIVALGIISFAGLNFASNRWNTKVDLSYFKTTKPGTSTMALAKSLSEPVSFVLFFPAGNEVLEQLRTYLDYLAAATDKVQIETADQALDPELARKYKVRGNGYLVMVRGEKNDSLRIGLELEEARGMLRELDGKLHERLIKLVRPARVAYFTTGHLERDTQADNPDKRRPLREFRALLEALGFRVERLGVGEGLASKVPEDAALVVIAGPVEPFLPEERAAIKSFLDRGGRLLAMLDPDHGTVEPELMASLGVEVSKALVANNRFGVRVEGSAESPYNLATSRASAHPSVDSLSRANGQLYAALLGVGAVSKTEKPPVDLNITMTLRGMPESWVDKEANRRFDKESESRDPVDFAAAIERPASAVKTPGAPAANEPAAPAPQPASTGPMRAVVMGDADIAALAAVPGNTYVLVDSLNWLAGDDQIAGTIESEKDPPIVHRKDKDSIWFYGTGFLVPAAVLGGGLLFTTRRRRKEG